MLTIAGGIIIAVFVLAALPLLLPIAAGIAIVAAVVLFVIWLTGSPAVLAAIPFVAVAAIVRVQHVQERNAEYSRRYAVAFREKMERERKAS